MVTEESTGQGGQADDTPPSDRPSTPREDGGADPFADRAGHPLSGGDSPPPRPYNLTPVETLPQAVACGEWIAKQAGETIGIALATGLPRRWGLASETEGWEMAVRRGTAEEIIRAALKQGLTQTGGLQLVTQDARTLLLLLSDWLGLSAAEISQRVVGDMTAMLHATGKIWQRPVWSWAADDAYDVLVTEMHWKTGAPSYYATVGVPRALSTFSPALAADAEGVAWRISYDDLLLKAVTHYTREPVMVRAFMDEEDPVPKMGELLGIKDVAVTYAALVWSALNWDTFYMRNHYPDMFSLLPPELDSLRQGVESKLSVLSLGLSRAREDYTRNKSGASIWGRQLPWGAEMGRVHDHQFMGSVDDIVDLLVISAQGNLRESVSVEEPEYAPTDRTIIIKGRLAATLENVPLLKSVAQLNNPLGVPLNPSIIIGD